MTQNSQKFIDGELDVGSPSSFVGASTSAPTREEPAVSANRLEASIDFFVDKHGNEVERRYEDCFRPLTAFQLAQAFPECRDLAIARRRYLMRAANWYRDRIAAIMADATYSDEEKYLAVVVQKTYMKLDPEIQEINLLDQYLRMIPKQEESDTSDPIQQEREQFNIEKAKAFLLQELFDPINPRETSSTITCKCPFHSERTGSFVIYKKSNRYKCFSCGESGDSIHFYMNIHNCDFKTAVRSLT